MKDFVDQDSTSDDEKSQGMMMQEDDDGDVDYLQIVMDQEEDDWGVGYHNESEDEDDEDPRRESLRNFRQYVRWVRDDTTSFTPLEAEAIKLMDTLRKKKASLDTYDDIMDWHIAHCGSGRSRQFISRAKMIKRLAKRYNIPWPLVSKKKITLPHSKARVNVVHHDAAQCVVSLLTDPRFSDDDFLHFGNDPLAPPPEDLDYISDINTGLCYTETYKKLITNPQKQMLVPISFYLDGAVTGQFDKLSLEALKMTLGIFNRRARDKEYAWRTLGYCPSYTPAEKKGHKMLEESLHAAAILIPESDSDDSSDEDNAKNNGQNAAVGDGQNDENETVPADADGLDGNGDAQNDGFEYDAEEEYELKDHKAQDLHRTLASILNSFKQLTKTGMVWDYKYRGKLCKGVELVFFVAFVKCDTDEADVLCGKCKSRGKFVAQLCRHCCTKTNDCDKINVRFKLKTVEMIRKLVDANNEEKLKQMSQQNIKNAWHDVRFGLHNKQGIHGSCPMELLHHILLGLYKYVRDNFFIQIGATSIPAEEINGLAKLLGQLLARQADRDRPKTNFAKGIFEGKIMGKEFSGVLLLIAAILQTTAGREILKNSRHGHFEQDWLIDDWALLVETLLEWEAFLKLDKMDVNIVKRLKKKHQFLVFLLKKICRRTKGMGLKLVKFHACLHLMQDILNFGVPTNVDTGSNESHHKPAKAAAKLTQRDVKKFEEQTAIRLQEFHLVDLAMCELKELKNWLHFDATQKRGLDETSANEATIDDTLLTTGSTFKVFKDSEGAICFDCFRKTTKRASWPPDLVEFLFNLQEAFSQATNMNDLVMRTEHKRGSQIFRGDPNFRGTGAWNDWALFDWGKRHGHHPAKIWCFVDFSEAPADFRLHFAQSHLEAAVHAVVESASVDSINPGRSDMFSPIIEEAEQLENDGQVAKRRFHLASVDAILKPLIVIPDVGSANKLRHFQVRPRREWSERFIWWVQQPHAVDVDEMDD